MIRDLKGDGMTMLLATHEMGFARQVADRVCFLERGRILEQGPPDAGVRATRESPGPSSSCSASSRPAGSDAEAGQR